MLHMLDLECFEHRCTNQSSEQHSSSSYRKTPPQRSSSFMRLSRDSMCLVVPKRQSNPAQTPSPILEGTIVGFEHIFTHIGCIIRQQSRQHGQYYQLADIKMRWLYLTAISGFRAAIFHIGCSNVIKDCKARPDVIKIWHRYYSYRLEAHHPF